jgi:hypothetical protein
MPAAKNSESGGVTITRLKDKTVSVPIIGLTPVIPHKWSEKAKMMMPGYPLGIADKLSKKGERQPEDEAESCVYRLEDGRPGIQAVAFKAAMVGACRFFDSLKMTEAKLLFFVEGDGPDQLVAIDGEPHLREDTPRNANGGADLRYRYAFFPWSATLRIRFTPKSIDADSVASLVDAAGRVGVGDWRPGSPRSSTGTFGTFRVKEAEAEE